MKWSDFVNVIEYLPKTPEFFNDIIASIRDRYARNLNVNLALDKSTESFDHQIQQLCLPIGQAAVSSADLIQRWYKLLVLLSKHTNLLKRGSGVYRSFQDGIHIASKLISFALNARTQRFGFQQSAEKLLSVVMRGIESMNVEKFWVTKQDIVYQLLQIHRKIQNSGNPHWQQHLNSVTRLIDIAVHTDFKNSVPPALVAVPGPVAALVPAGAPMPAVPPAAAKIPRQRNAAPFYAELVNLIGQTEDEGRPFEGLKTVQSLTVKELFNKNNPHDIDHCRVIEMKARWLKAFNTISLPWLWGTFVNPDDQRALDDLRQLMISYDVGNHAVYLAPVETWVGQIITHRAYLDNVWWPPLKRAITQQIDECIHTVVINRECSFEQYTHIYSNLPLNAVSESVVLAKLIKDFKLEQTKATAQLRFLTIALAREKASGKLNPHLKPLLQQLSQQKLPANLRQRFTDLITARNQFIQKRLTGFLGLFRKEEKKQLFTQVELRDFIRPEHMTQDDMDEQFAPFQKTVSDEQYRQQLQQKVQLGAPGITQLGVMKVDKFKQAVALCEGDDDYLAAVTQSLSQSALLQLTSPMVGDDGVAVPGSAVLMRQSIKAMKRAVDNPHSPISQTFTPEDILKLQKIIQHFDDLEKVEDEKITIMDDPDLFLFQSTLQRRLAGMWLTAQVINTNDVSVQATDGVRVLSAVTEIGGGLISLPVISGVVTALGKSLDLADQYRKQDNYLRLAELAPSGTSAEMFAEMVTRILTRRYAQQIRLLTRTGIQQFAEYCCTKLKGALLSQKSVHVAHQAQYDSKAYSTPYALMNQEVYCHAQALADIISRPLSAKTVAFDIKPQLDMYKNLKLKSKQHFHQAVWNAEALLLEPDLCCGNQLYRSPYAKQPHSQRSEFGFRHGQPHEITHLQALGPVEEEEETENQLHKLPRSVLKTILNAEALAKFAHQHSMQTSDTVRQLTQVPRSPSTPLQLPATQKSQQKLLPYATMMTTWRETENESPGIVRAGVGYRDDDVEEKSPVATTRSSSSSSSSTGSSCSSSSYEEDDENSSWNLLRQFPSPPTSSIRSRA